MPLLSLQAFDYPMSLNEAISDTFDAGVQDDDNLTLLYEANKDVMMTVKTPSGMTEPQFLESAVCQGGTWGPLPCRWTRWGRSSSRGSSPSLCWG
jgi:hypothetical protein